MTERPHWIRWPEPGRPRFGYGADYNPEQWPREVWDEDMRLMREAGVTIVSLGIFSWSLLEPSDGEFDFGFVDEAMDLLHAHGIAVDLATATASPPAWLVRKHPEMLPVDAEGRTLGFGGRQSWSPSSRAYREHSVRLVRALAEHVKDHPALAMWHISNELGCHNARSYDEESAVAFRGWLAERYGTIDALNAAWATNFWSQRYGDFAEIDPPRLAPTYPNPGQQLDFHRFSDAQLLGQYRAEIAVLNEITPDVPCTTNFMVSTRCDLQDYLAWGHEMDVVTTDHYLFEGHADDARELAWSADLTRGTARGRPWMLMEQSPSAVNWGQVNRAKEPGEMWRNSLAQVARGADAICYFQWRASAGGAEKFHSGMVPHAGEHTRVFREVVEQGRRLAALTEVLGSRADNDVAMLFDYPAWWASELDSHPHNAGFRYPAEAERWYRPFYEAGIGVDIVGVDADLAGYRLLIVPTLYLVSDATADAVRAFAEAGGTVLVTYFSGIVDDTDRVRLGGYPGAFRDLLGVRAEEFRPLRGPGRVTLSDGTSPSLWSEDLEVTDAEAVLTYADGALAGKPAVTRRRAGAGEAWYVSADLEAATVRSLAARLAETAGVSPVAPSTGRLELARRVHSDGRTYVFALNHSGEPASFSGSGTDLLTGATFDGEVPVPAGETVVLRLN